MLPGLCRNRGTLSAPTMDDFVERFFSGWPTFEKESEIIWTPRVDVHETDNEIIIIDAELPGIRKEDIKVEIKDNVLTISGERKQEKKSETETTKTVECRYGKFERSFGLPETVTTENVNAKFKDGILTLTLPKTEKAIPKPISVTVE
jgi:HSP20 family protein